MKCTFVIETTQPDENGDVILFEGMKIPNRILVSDNFKRDLPPIGMAEVKKEGDKLIATTEMSEKYLDYYPAIGFKIIKQKITDNGKIWQETILQEIGLSETKNTNPEIKTIREQCNL